MSGSDGMVVIFEKLDEGWLYAGSREEGNYLKTSIPYLPDHEDFCICGTAIKYNYFIMNPERNKVLVVGSKCIKLFTNGILKTCEICEAPHGNRVYDLCDEHKLPVIAAENSVKRIAKQVIKAMNKFFPTIEGRIDEGIECYLSKPIYLNVPYKDKERCKLYGCKWSTKHIKWYCHEESISRIVRQQVKWCQPSYKFINVQYVDYVYE